MEFDSLGAYTGVPAPMPAAAPAASVRPQSRSIESAQADPDAQVELSTEIPAQDWQADYKNDVGNSDKSAKDRNDHNNPESVLSKAIDSANKKLAGTNYGLQYSIHEKTKLVMIKVINSETQETVREVPPQKHLDAVAKMWELAGLLVDEKR